MKPFPRVYPSQGRCIKVSQYVSFYCFSSSQTSGQGLLPSPVPGISGLFFGVKPFWSRTLLLSCSKCTEQLLAPGHVAVVIGKVNCLGADTLQSPVVVDKMCCQINEELHASADLF